MERNEASILRELSVEAATLLTWRTSVRRQRGIRDQRWNPRDCRVHKARKTRLC